MTSERPEVLNTDAVLAEGPSWDADNDLLYWVDIEGMKVHVYDPETDTDRSIDVGQRVGAVAARKSGGLVLAMHHGFYLLDLETEKLTPISDPEADRPNNRFNDGKCDAAGRFLAGTLDFEEKEPLGAFYRMDTDRSVTKLFGDVTISNGLAWSPDNGTMYYIDTPKRRVDAFDYDIETGTPSNGRTVVEIPAGEGGPDGMASDSEGMIWVAQWGGWKVSRWNPATGKLIGEIKMPVERVTACAFGGKDLDELYVTTARRDLDEEGMKKQPLAGKVFRVKVGIKGLPTYKFGG